MKMSKLPYHTLLLVFVIALFGAVTLGGAYSTAEEREQKPAVILTASLSEAAPDTALAGEGFAPGEDIGAAVIEQPTAAFITIPESDPPIFDARAAVIMDIGSPVAYFARDPFQRWPIASITKLMTILVARESIARDEEVRISEAAAATEGIAGGFLPGERYQFIGLERAALAVSSNDAIAAIEEHYDAKYGAGALLRSMNTKAAELGMAETTFADAIGLSILNQSTAVDVSKLVKHIYVHDPDILEISRAAEVQFREIGSGKMKTLKNINSFAGAEDFLGGKTGFTDEAGGNLVSIFKIGSRPVVIVVFGSGDRFLATETLKNWIVAK